MKKLTYISLFLLLLTNSYSQVIDTVFVDETSTYKVRNQQNNVWLHWETDAEIISDNPSRTDSIIILWNTAGIYYLTVYEETENNCKGELAEIEILVIETDFDIELDIPNVFTPTEDGINDYFIVRSNYPPDNYRITILNRWGNKMYEANNINDSWDGKLNEKYCSPGVYYYVIHYQNKEMPETRKGTVRVFR